MSKKSKKKRIGVVYSTQTDFEYQYENNAETILEKHGQVLRMEIQKKGRAGKVATVIRGFEGSDEDLKTLAKSIKQHIGMGGSVKEGEIIIQGSHKEKIIAYLRKSGYSNSR